MAMNPERAESIELQKAENYAKARKGFRLIAKIAAAIFLLFLLTFVYSIGERAGYVACSGYNDKPQPFTPAESSFIARERLKRIMESKQ